MTLDIDTLQRVYTDKQKDVQPIRFFCRGDAYKFWGLVSSDLHLVCPAVGGQMFLLGTDRLGRDVLSRILYGARISLTIGLIGIAISFVLGIVIGGLAGYRGGVFDLIVQRLIEVLQSLPALAACGWRLPPSCRSPGARSSSISASPSFLASSTGPDWPAPFAPSSWHLREEDYVQAAQLMGASTSASSAGISCPASCRTLSRPPPSPFPA